MTDEKPTVQDVVPETSREKAEAKTKTSLNELKRSSERDDHTRQERFKTTEGWVLIMLFLLSVLAIIILGFVLLWHMVTPENWPYYRLMEHKIEAIRQFFLGGGAGAIFVIKYYDRRNK